MRFEVWVLMGLNESEAVVGTAASLPCLTHLGVQGTETATDSSLKCLYIYWCVLVLAGNCHVLLLKCFLLLVLAFGAWPSQMDACVGFSWHIYWE